MPLGSWFWIYKYKMRTWEMPLETICTRRQATCPQPDTHLGKNSKFSSAKFRKYRRKTSAHFMIFSVMLREKKIRLHPPQLSTTRRRVRSCQVLTSVVKYWQVVTRWGLTSWVSIVTTMIISILRVCFERCKIWWNTIIIPGPSSSWASSRNPPSPIGCQLPAFWLVKLARLRPDWSRAYVGTSPSTTMGHVWGGEGGQGLTFLPLILQKSNNQNLSVHHNQEYTAVSKYLSF